MTSITWVIPTWLTYVITVFLFVDIALTILKLKWERRLRKAKDAAREQEGLT